MLLLLMLTGFGPSPGWSETPVKEQKPEPFYWLWSWEDVSRKANDIIWWQTRLGQLPKQKRIKYRPTATPKIPKNSIFPDDKFRKSRKNLSFTP